LFAPSTARNTAPRPRPSSDMPPSVCSNVARSYLGVIVHPTVGT
jgi:hypothetical protein